MSRRRSPQSAALNANVAAYKAAADYAGRYSNDMLGNIDIVVEQIHRCGMGYLVYFKPFTEKEASGSK